MDTKIRFFPKTPQSHFLLGPRGTGKSTWLNQHFPDALKIDLLSPNELRHYSAYPERLKELIAAHPQKSTIIIDEIQKAPALLDVIHQMIELKSNLTFICTGSSARKLKRQSSNLLAGRLLMKSTHPFMAHELGDDFILQKALTIGMLPLVWDAKDPGETLKSYAALYLKEEIQQEGLTRNIGTFARFLEVIRFSHGSQINISEIARDTSVGRKTIEGYIHILEDMLLAFRLPIFRKHAKRHLSQHPKFYYFDTGVYQSLRPKGPLDSPEFIGGAAAEGLVAQHLRAYVAYSEQDTQIFFWRTKSGLEVDFILYGPQKFCAIEVKNSSNVHSKNVKSLLSFQKDYPQAQLLLLYAGKKRIKIKGVLCLPIDEFLCSLVPGQPMPFT